MSSGFHTRQPSCSSQRLSGSSITSCRYVASLTGMTHHLSASLPLSYRCQRRIECGLLRVVALGVGPMGACLGECGGRLSNRPAYLRLAQPEQIARGGTAVQALPQQRLGLLVAAIAQVGLGQDLLDDLPLR